MFAARRLSSSRWRDDNMTGCPARAPVRPRALPTLPEPIIPIFIGIDSAAARREDQSIVPSAAAAAAVLRKLRRRRSAIGCQLEQASRAATWQCYNLGIRWNWPTRKLGGVL